MKPGPQIDPNMKLDSESDSETEASGMVWLWGRGHTEDLLGINRLRCLIILLRVAGEIKVWNGSEGIVKVGGGCGGKGVLGF